MSLLLDTCVVLWLMLEPRRIAAALLEMLENSENSIFVSAVSTWEVIVKWQSGKLMLPISPTKFFSDVQGEAGVTPLPFDESSALQLFKLPKLHNDPFDRMLICQAIEHGLAIVTPDELIGQYPIKTLWM